MMAASPGEASLSTVCPAQEVIRSGYPRLAAAVFGPIERFSVRHGIAQFDTPQQVYDAPADAFVASFIGDFSLVSGQAGGEGFRIHGADSVPLQLAAGSRRTAFPVVRRGRQRREDASRHPD